MLTDCLTERGTLRARRHKAESVGML